MKTKILIPLFLLICTYSLFSLSFYNPLTQRRVELPPDYFLHGHAVDFAWDAGSLNTYFNVRMGGNNYGDTTELYNLGLIPNEHDSDGGTVDTKISYSFRNFTISFSTIGNEQINILNSLFWNKYGLNFWYQSYKGYSFADDENEIEIHNLYPDMKQTNIGMDISRFFISDVYLKAINNELYEPKFCFSPYIKISPDYVGFTNPGTLEISENSDENTLSYADIYLLNLRGGISAVIPIFKFYIYGALEAGPVLYMGEYGTEEDRKTLQPKVSMFGDWNIGCGLTLKNFYSTLQMGMISRSMDFNNEDFLNPETGLVEESFLYQYTTVIQYLSIHVGLRI